MCTLKVKVNVLFGITLVHAWMPPPSLFHTHTHTHTHSLKVVRRIPAIFMVLVDSSSVSTSQPLPADHDDGHHQQVAAAMASSEQSERSSSATRRSGGSHHKTKAAESYKERREKGKGQGSRSQGAGGGAKKRPSKRTQAAASGGHGRVKGHSRTAQASEITEDTVDQKT